MDYTLIALLVAFGPFMGLVWLANRQERQKQEVIYKRTATIARMYAIRGGKYR